MTLKNDFPLRADMRRYQGGTPASFSQEMFLLLLVVMAGVAGMWAEDVRWTCGIFFGGIGAIVVLKFPQLMEEMRETANKLAKSRQKQAASPAAPAQQTAEELPSAELTANLIRKRRSIFPKDYDGRKLSRMQIEQLLEAARWAPNHGNTEPWRFVVLEGNSKAAFEELTLDLVASKTPADKADKAVEKMKAKKEKTWPLVSHYIAICLSRQPNKAGKLNPEWEDMCAVACAVQNMYLQATAMGIAPYWSSWQEVARESEEMHSFLGLQPGDRCLGMLTLGFSDRADSYRASRSPITDKVVFKS